MFLCTEAVFQRLKGVESVISDMVVDLLRIRVMKKFAREQPAMQKQPKSNMIRRKYLMKSYWKCFGKLMIPLL